MEHGLSSVVAWQTVVPLFMAAMTIFMAKWLSHSWAQTAVQRTVRVVSRLGSRDARRAELRRLLGVPTRVSENELDDGPSETTPSTRNGRRTKNGGRT
jgi:hypothetical protein